MSDAYSRLVRCGERVHSHEGMAAAAAATPATLRGWAASAYVLSAQEVFCRSSDEALFPPRDAEPLTRGEYARLLAGYKLRPESYAPVHVCARDHIPHFDLGFLCPPSSCRSSSRTR